MKILANDGIDPAGLAIFQAAGHEVITQKIAQAELKDKIAAFDAVIVRSATKITAEIMDAANLKVIGRAGVGLDNIDVKHAGTKNIPVFNTPNASSRSVAELVFAHMFSLARNLHTTNRQMPSAAKTQFNELKKEASKGFELQGKTLGIIGFGRIGQEVAKMAIGLGMDVVVHDYKHRSFELTVTFHPHFRSQNFKIQLTGVKKETVLEKADILSVHTSGSTEVIGENEINHLKPGAVLINCARGGVVNEKALRAALDSGKISFAGVDVFETEPPVNDLMLDHPNLSLSPHIGASTSEAQERVGIELAEKICQYLAGVAKS